MARSRPVSVCGGGARGTFSAAGRGGGHSGTIAGRAATRVRSRLRLRARAETVVVVPNVRVCTAASGVSVWVQRGGRATGEAARARRRRRTPRLTEREAGARRTAGRGSADDAAGTQKHVRKKGQYWLTRTQLSGHHALTHSLVNCTAETARSDAHVTPNAHAHTAHTGSTHPAAGAAAANQVLCIDWWEGSPSHSLSSRACVHRRSTLCACERALLRSSRHQS